ncbi:MAG: GNAT family N-acetyltransferase [Anaerolineae bacterium]|nr:GNAT family N-acetyltransferase [Anaerolineae bacterium]
MLKGLLVDLVPYGKAFLENDHEWENGIARFWSNLGECPIVSRAQVEARHQEWFESNESYLGVPFGVQTKDGIPLGYFGINWMVPHCRSVMVGAVINDPDYWGGGYGTDALLLLMDYAFDWLDMRKVWLGTMSLNERVMRQMEKVGFTLEVRQREAVYAAGEWHDSLLYGLLRDEWPGRAALIERFGLQARPE